MIIASSGYNDPSKSKSWELFWATLSQFTSSQKVQLPFDIMTVWKKTEHV